MSAKISAVKKGIRDNLTSKIKRLDSVSHYLNTVTVRQYVQAQTNRWKSQGASEYKPWPNVSEEYAKRKRRMYAGFPGGGTVVMVATGTLVETVTKNFHKVVLKRGLIINVPATGPTEYFRYANEKRSFTKWSRQTISEMRKGLREFIFKARKPG